MSATASPAFQSRSNQRKMCAWSDPLFWGDRGKCVTRLQRARGSASTIAPCTRGVPAMRPRHARDSVLLSLTFSDSHERVQLAERAAAAASGAAVRRQPRAEVSGVGAEQIAEHHAEEHVEELDRRHRILRHEPLQPGGGGHGERLVAAGEEIERGARVDGSAPADGVDECGVGEVEHEGVAGVRRVDGAEEAGLIPRDAHPIHAQPQKLAVAVHALHRAFCLLQEQQQLLHMRRDTRTLQRRAHRGRALIQHVKDGAQPGCGHCASRVGAARLVGALEQRASLTEEQPPRDDRARHADAPVAPTVAPVVAAQQGA